MHIMLFAIHVYMCACVRSRASVCVCGYCLYTDNVYTLHPFLYSNRNENNHCLLRIFVKHSRAENVCRNKKFLFEVSFMLYVATM